MKNNNEIKIIVRCLMYSDISECVEIYKLNYPNDSQEWINSLKHELNQGFNTFQFTLPRYFVSIIEGKIVGFAGYSDVGFDADIFSLLWCNVHPDFKGKGIGKKLTERRIKEITDEGGKKILSSQAKSVKWHLERFGFEVIDENGNCDGEEYFLMRKTIKEKIKYNEKNKN